MGTEEQFGVMLILSRAGRASGQQSSHSWIKVAPCSFSFHLDRNGGVGPVIWSLPIAKLGLCSISVLNTLVLIFPFLCLPTRREKNNQRYCLGGATLRSQCPRVF